jgi:hypothetical protein
VTNRIFVQIPAYRDRELLPTLESLFENAGRPERLRVVVAWQYAPEEAHLEHALARWENLELIKSPAAQSQGCNWARRLVQKQWAGEHYTLFLDSHHRFVPGWDVLAIDMLESLRAAGSHKPILTGYLPPYDPERGPSDRGQYIFNMRAADRRRGLLFHLVGDPVPDWRALQAPLPARFTSLHFLLADGSFNEEVAIDESIYFFVDEIAIALRAYTRGYDLFHPYRILGWHLYDRATRVAHWEDNPDSRQRFEITHRRIQALYGGRWRGRYGLGEARSAADYERIIGDQLTLTEAP